MCKTSSILCLCLLLSINMAVSAEEAEDKFLFYGKIHYSLDISNKDDPAATTRDGASISSNSSRLGLKGKSKASGLDFFYQLEQEVSMDESGGSFATRNSFAGIKGGWGKIILGIHDTPFKKLGSKWGLFSDTVADRRTILGASYSDGNSLNERVKNAFMYSYKQSGLGVDVMYALDGETQQGEVDNNSVTTASLAVNFENKMLWAGASFEKWEGHSDAADVEAYRIAAKYSIKMVQFGILFENIDSKTQSQWNRNAYGLNGKFKINDHSHVSAQYVWAEEADVPDTGGSAVGLGYFHKLDKQKQLYVAFAATDNENSAQFKGVDGGHGDEVSTINGGSPNSLSAGFIIKF